MRYKPSLLEGLAWLLLLMIGIASILLPLEAPRVAGPKLWNPPDLLASLFGTAVILWILLKGLQFVQIVGGYTRWLALTTFWLWVGFVAFSVSVYGLNAFEVPRSWPVGAGVATMIYGWFLHDVYIIVRTRPKTLPGYGGRKRATADEGPAS